MKIALRIAVGLFPHQPWSIQCLLMSLIVDIHLSIVEKSYISTCQSIQQDSSFLVICFMTSSPRGFGHRTWLVGQPWLFSEGLNPLISTKKCTVTVEPEMYHRVDVNLYWETKGVHTKAPHAWQKLAPWSLGYKNPAHHQAAFQGRET